MATTALIDIQNKDVLGALREFLKSVINQDEISAILAPCRLPMKNMVMPTLITDPKFIEGVDPLSPAFPINGAKIVSKLTRKPSGKKVAAVMRPCEIRAFIELVKLNQGKSEDLVIIGIDCLGAMQNRDYVKWVGEDIDESTKNFYASVLDGKSFSPENIDLAPACQICESFIPMGADITIGIIGIETSKNLLIQAKTVKGENLIGPLNLTSVEEPLNREKILNRLMDEKIANRDKIFSETKTATENLEKLTRYLANCVNCYNCRVACPVCYCRECVFVTDVFDHDPYQYLRWADRKGLVKMPTDTVFYHITRLAHISTACVGCGQCSNACPNDIPVMELFRSVSQHTQKAFDYVAGESLKDKPPLSVFKEDEFDEVVGI